MISLLSQIGNSKYKSIQKHEIGIVIISILKAKTRNFENLAAAGGVLSLLSQIGFFRHKITDFRDSEVRF